MPEGKSPSSRRPRYRAESLPWDAASVRALREHLGATQGELADELGVRQQTVSEWETSVYRPRGASARLLSMVAEQNDFQYRAESSAPPPENEPAEDGDAAR
ncbi:MAG: helix-turn-helix domain-containing protein [Chloroflexota bacterium]|nr:helix-turn-helix domain-containing protein [Chloroflexota bacterium]